MNDDELCKMSTTPFFYTAAAAAATSDGCVVSEREPWPTEQTPKIIFSFIIICPVVAAARKSVVNATVHGKEEEEE